VNLLLLATLAAVVLVPLAREYADLRAAGLARVSALGVVSLVIPALGVGLALTLPLAGRPEAQWAVTVILTVALYSAATRPILARASSAATAPSRRT
jgi:uncharacterized membrane-anchored protein